MNIRMLTTIRMLKTEERERLAYIEDHPDKELLGELVDAQHALDRALDDLEDE